MAGAIFKISAGVNMTCRTEVRRSSDQVRNHNVRIAGYHTLNSWCAASIRHALKARACGTMKEYSANVSHIANPSGRGRDFIRVSLHPGNKTFQGE
jgi:hypothetical protein